MCGIYGSVNFRKPSFENLKNSLKHRGPDGAKEYIYKNIYMFHARLSIQDLSNKADQPFHYNGMSIIYNGEIYNHTELRKLCQDHKFTTSSDTETLLVLYSYLGVKMFDYLDGMFAFCIFDKNKEEIVLSRDRAGKKPLYLYSKGKVNVFSSELNAIRGIVRNLEISNDAINSYLKCGFFPLGATAYKNIVEVDPGTFIKIKTKDSTKRKENYFDIYKYYSQPKYEDSVLVYEKVEKALIKSVKNRVKSSDLEVGAFLSGGIDSSLIVALASQFQRKLKTFTVKFDGANDESDLAKLTAKKYSTDHNEINISYNLKNDIEKILLNYGQPFADSSAVPSYYVSKEAKKHVTVILNGDGADELFGGYRRYVPASLKILDIASKINFIRKFLPMPSKDRSLYGFIYRLIGLSSKESIDFYLSSTSDIFEDVLSIENNNITNRTTALLKEIESSSFSKLNQMLYSDFILLLRSDLLIKMDIATMANSIEARSPFLSKYILEIAPRVPDNLKINNLNTKHILKKIALKYLPTTIVKQPKRGFEVPLRKWVDEELKSPIRDLLNQESHCSNLLGWNFIESLLKGKEKVSSRKRSKMLWSMYCLEVWLKNR